MENILGTKLADRYLIEELVGVGGMCNVYRAFDAEALQTVAVKMLRDEYAADEEYLRRFRNESRAINALSHPNIVKIYDVVLDAPNPYLVMEYVSGITLKEYIDRKKPLPGRTAANIAVPKQPESPMVLKSARAIIASFFIMICSSQDVGLKW